MRLVSDFYRHRERLRARVRELAACPGALALDVGCKHGDISRSLARTQRFLVALDIERHPDWAQPEDNLVFLAASAMALPFADSIFDVVVSSECLQYVPDPPAAMVELARVLKPGGTMVVSFPEGGWLADGLDPDNLSFLFRSRFRPGSTAGQSFVHFPRVSDMRRRAETVLECVTAERRGTLLYIWFAALIDQLQAVRVRLGLGRRGGAWSRFADAAARLALTLAFAAMNLDCRLRPPVLGYNNVLSFHKPVAAARGKPG